MELDAVDAQGPVPVGDDVVSGHADNAFDEVVTGVLGEDADRDEEVLGHALQTRGLLRHQPVIRIGEDDDVASLHGVGVVHGHSDAVALVEGVLHGSRRDGEALDDEGADEGDDHHGDHQVGQGDAPLLEAVGDPPTHRGGLCRSTVVPSSGSVAPTVSLALTVTRALGAGPGDRVTGTVGRVLKILIVVTAHRPSPVRRVMTTS